MRQWQLQEAKAHLSQVVKEAMRDGPQQISLRGEPVVVVIAKDEYEKLVKPKPSLVEFMRQSPFVGAGLRIHRDKSLTRDTEL